MQSVINLAPLVLLAVGNGKRARLMRAACSELGREPPLLVEWEAWLDQPRLLDKALAHPCLFKIETPGDDPALHYRLLRDGCAALGHAPPAPPEHGELSVSGAWFAGFTRAMDRLTAQLADLPHVQVMNPPPDLLAMTDKLACQQRLLAHGAPIPTLLGPVQGYRQLRAMLDEHRLDQVFVKTRYGSSAAGVLAYRRDKRGREQATTSAQLSQDGRLYNVKRLRRYEQRADIEQVIDLLARQESYAETWVAKPRTGNGHYDLRVLTLGGRPAHRIARVGERMMTNLHLDNRRADPASLLGPAGAAALDTAARQAASAFPRSHLIGLDIVVNKGKAHVLEANGFGDLLPGLLWEGRDTYAGQLHTFNLPTQPQ